MATGHFVTHVDLVIQMLLQTHSAVLGVLSTRFRAAVTQDTLLVETAFRVIRAKHAVKMQS